MTASSPATPSQAQSALFGETDLQSPTATETLAAESGTADDDDDRDDERDDENEAPVREVDDATEAPEEFEVDDEEDLTDDELADDELEEEEMKEDELEDEELAEESDLAEDSDEE